MLNVFRENLKNLRWVLWLVVVVMVAYVFIEVGGRGMGGTGSLDAAATVDGHRITVGEFQRAYERTEASYRQRMGDQFTPEAAREMGLAQQVLASLIDRQVLLTEARESGLRVGDTELSEAIRSMPVFQNEMGQWGGQDQYRNTLRANSFTVGDFEAAVRDDLLVQKFQTLLARGVHVSDDDLEERFRTMTERAAVRYVRVTASEMLAEVAVDDAAIRAHFDADPQRFELGERRVADYLTVNAAELSATLTIGEEELRTWYEQNLDRYTVPARLHARHILRRTNDRSLEEARQELAEIRRRLDAGEDFAALAEELSEDPGSAAQGGDLGTFTAEEMVEPFSEAAFAAAAGELVGPVETQFGVHLIEVLERQEGSTTPFEDVRNQLDARLRAERAQTLAEQQAQAWVARLRDGAHDRATLQQIAAEGEAVTFGTTPAFAQTDAVPGIGRSNALTQAIFQLAPDGVSDAVRLPSSWGVAVLREIQPPRLPEFDEVREEVARTLRQERALDLAVERLQPVRAALDGGQDLDAAAAAIEGTVQDSGEFSHGTTAGTIGAAPELIEQVFTQEEGEAGGPLRTDNAAYVYVVSSRTGFDAEDFENRKDALRSQLALMDMDRLLSARIQQRRAGMKIRLNQELLDSLGSSGSEGSGRRVWSSEHGHWHDADDA